MEHADFVEMSTCVCVQSSVCVCLCSRVCVCVLVQSSVYAEWRGDDASACRLPFIEIPLVAAVFPSFQEMTRRASAWWIGRGRAAERCSAAHILGNMCSGYILSGTNGIIITGGNVSLMHDAVPWFSLCFASHSSSWAVCCTLGKSSTSISVRKEIRFECRSKLRLLCWKIMTWFSLI